MLRHSHYLHLVSLRPSAMSHDRYHRFPIPCRRACYVSRYLPRNSSEDCEVACATPQYGGELRGNARTKFCYLRAKHGLRPLFPNLLHEVLDRVGCPHLQGRPCEVGEVNDPLLPRLNLWSIADEQAFGTTSTTRWSPTYSIATDKSFSPRAMFSVAELWRYATTKSTSKRSALRTARAAALRRPKK